MKPRWNGSLVAASVTALMLFFGGSPGREQPAGFSVTAPAPTAPVDETAAPMSAAPMEPRFGLGGGPGARADSACVAPPSAQRNVPTPGRADVPPFPPGPGGKAIPAGDFNGDGSADVYVHDTHLGPEPPRPRPVSITARSGSDGRELWMRTAATAEWSQVTPGRVGPGGEPGLFWEYGVKTSSTTGQVITRTRITALDGSGRDVWTREFTGLTVYPHDEYPRMAGLMEAAPGAAADPLVALYVSDPPVAARVKMYVVSGATGDIVARSDTGLMRYDPRRSEENIVLDPWVSPGPDVTGDGKDDILLLFQGTVPARRFSAYSGSDGALVWSRSDRFDPEKTSYEAAGDADGDGAGDLMVAHGNDDNRSATLISGRGGATIVSSAHSVAIPLGSIDPDRQAEVVIVSWSPEQEAPADAFVRYRAIDGTGEKTYDRTCIMESNGERLGANVPGAVGDVDGDNVPDMAHSMYTEFNPSEPNAQRRSRSALVSGRDGSIIRQWDNGWSQPNASIDGHGSDFVDRESACEGSECEFPCEPTYCPIRYVAHDGRTGAALWKSQRFEEDHYFGFDGGAVADLTGDGRAEAVLHANEGCCYTKEHTIVLSATDGRILWII